MRLLIFLYLLCAPLANVGALASSNEFFETRIRPYLYENCYKCHGGEKTSAELRVDTRESLLEGGEHGAAVVPGDSRSSLLLLALDPAHEELMMPPGKVVPENVRNDFAVWIDSGAPWPQTGEAAERKAGRHWAFLPLMRIEVPDQRSLRSTHPIDRFLEVRQRELGIIANPIADKRTLMRRASFDLVGLPPDWKRMNAFSEDDDPTAYEKLIDELLQSGHYGERWGRHWLDLARYADTAGENSDYPIPQAYLYRDYVIDSFNADKPYDQFIKEQIAGDIMALDASAERYAEQVIATGFLAQAKRFGTGDLEDMHLIIEDTLDTIGKSIMGLGLRCARCHDHKYDPTTMEDYYGLYGIFQSTSYPHPGGESVKEQRYFVSTVHPDELARLDEAYCAKHAEEIEELESLIESGAEVESSKARLEEIQSNTPSRKAPLAYGVNDGSATDSAIQKGGNPRSKGEVVPRGFPRFLQDKKRTVIPTDNSGRLQFAQWLVSAEHPLTARVMVNRIWQQHFGKPIVATPSNFGLQGDVPSHPELLDWLAQAFIDSGWSIKAMHRLIMTSDAYKRSNVNHSKNELVDSGNRYYWRFDRQRMDAETIRDSLLHLGGNLDLTRPGPHPFPPKEQWKWTAHHQFKAVYPSNHRSVYLMVQRLHPHPFLAIFNGPNTSASTDTRDRSTVPLQALFMANSNFVEQQAKGLADRLAGITDEPKSLISEMFRRVYLREPKLAEVARGIQYLAAYAAASGDSEGDAPDQSMKRALASYAKVLITSNEFLFVD